MQLQWQRRMWGRTDNFVRRGRIVFPTEGAPQCAALACDAMVTSFRFPGRPGKETKQRKGAAGQAKNPCRPDAIPLSL